MENKQQMPIDEFENHVQESWTRRITAPGYPDQYRQLQYLVDEGFLWKEATKLLRLREHIYENTEMRQRIEADPYLCFMRWLYRQGELTEYEKDRKR